MRLLITRHPHRDENMPAYVLGLAEANGYDRPSWITGLLDKYMTGQNGHLSRSDLYLKQVTLVPGIAKITGIPKDVLESAADRGGIVQKSNRPTQYCICGKWIGSQYLNFNNIKVCPKCINEDGAINRLWSIIPFTACPRHRILLLNKCPKCNMHFSWQRGKIAECQCGYDLRNSSVVTCNESGVELSEYIRVFFAAVTGQERNAADHSKNPIFNLTLAHMLSLLCFTARYFRDQAVEKKKFNISEYTNAEMHGLLCKATDVYRNWPKNYIHFLDNLRLLQRNSKEATGIRKDFGKYYFYLYKNFADRQYGFLQQAFENYVAASWAGGYLRPNSHVNGAIKKTKFVTARKAAELLDIKHQRIPGLVSQGFLRGNVKKMGSRTLCLVDKDSIASLKTRYKECKNLTHTARYLGTGTNNVREMIRNKSLDALHGPSTGNSGKWKITQKAINELFCRMDEAIIAINQDSQLSSVIYPLPKAALHLRISVAELVQAVLDREIRPSVKKPGHKLSSYLFSPANLAEFKKDKLQPRDGMLSVVDVCKRLGVSKLDAVYFLVRKGLIKAEKQKCGRATIIRIPMSEIERFRNAYVSASEVALKLKTCPRQVVTLLGQHGSQPISGSKIDGGPAYWVRRGDIVRYLYVDSKEFQQGYKNSLSRINLQLDNVVSNSSPLRSRVVVPTSRYPQTFRRKKRTDDE